MTSNKTIEKDIELIHSLFRNSEHYQSIKVEKLNGMTNKNYLVSIGQEELVVRIPGAMTQKLIDRKNEAKNSLLASELGINVDTISFDADTGIKITSFLPNASSFTHQTIKDEKAIGLIALEVKKLHQSNITFNNEFNVFAEFEKYFSLLNNKNSFLNAVPNMNNILEKFHALKIYFKDRTLCPCHNDLVPENILKEDENIYIIDWEYSGMNDPIFDIAAFFLESKLSETEQNIFLESYFGNVDLDTIKEEIKYYQFSQDILWFIWTLVKEESGEFFGDYGSKRLQRAIDLFQQIDK